MIVLYRLGDTSILCPGCQTEILLPLHEPREDDREPSPAFGTLVGLVCPGCHQEQELEPEELEPPI